MSETKISKYEQAVNKLYGLNTTIDHKEAFRLAEEAYKNGEKYSGSLLAQCLWHGYGTRASQRCASKIWNDCKDSDPFAAHSLAMRSFKEYDLEGRAIANIWMVCKTLSNLANEVGLNHRVMYTIAWTHNEIFNLPEEYYYCHECKEYPNCILGQDRQESRSLAIFYYGMCMSNGVTLARIEAPSYLNLKSKL